MISRRRASFFSGFFFQGTPKKYSSVGNAYAARAVVYTTIILNLNISLQRVSLKPSLVKAVSEKRFVTEFSDLKVTCTLLTTFLNSGVFCYSFALYLYCVN